MKKVLLFIAMVLMTLGVMAQSNVISYQAVVRDAQNRLVTNQPISVTIQVLDNSDAVQYTETDDVNSNANGLISLIVGDGNPTDFANINWDGAKFKTTVTVTNTGYEVTNTIPVTSVPLSMYASDVDPSGAAMTAVYAKIKADSTTVHSALVDSAGNIRTDMATMNTDLQNGIAENKQAIIDTAAHIRTEMSTMNTDLQNGINENKQAIIDTAAHIRTDMVTMNTDLQNGINENKQAIIDTAAHIRTEMSTMNTDLQNGINENKQAIIDTAAHIRTEMATMNTDLQNGINENKQAIIDTAAHIRAELPTVNDATLTIQTNGVATGTFTANQGTDQTINIEVPAQVNADWTATTGAAEILHKPTAVSAFTNDANYVDNTACSTVSFCDLVNRVLALETNQASMQHTIDSLKHVVDSIGDLIAASQTAPSFTHIGTTPSTYSIEVTSAVSIGGTPLTSRMYCINTTNDLATATCEEDNADSHTFSGLNANTQYYIWIKATNDVGTTVSDVQEVKTLYAKPTTGTIYASFLSGRRVRVYSNNMDLKGAPEGELTLTIYLRTDQTQNHSETFTVSGTSFVDTIQVPIQGTSFTVVATIDNGSSEGTGISNARNITVPVEAPTLGVMSIEGITTSSMTISVPVSDGGSELTTKRVCAAIHGTTDSVCKDMTLNEGVLSATLEGLANGEDYDIVINVATANGTASAVGSATTPTGIVLSVTPSTDETLYICANGDTKTITYTASISGDDAHLSQYTYKWSVKTGISGASFVDSTEVTTNVLSVNIPYPSYPSLSYYVQCIAYRADNLHFKDTIVVTCSSARASSYYMGLYSDNTNSKVKIMSVERIANASWLNESDVEKYTYKTTGTYTLENGTYHIILTSTEGCQKTIQDLVVTNTPPKTFCSGLTANSNETSYNGGIDGVSDDDGLYGGTTHTYGVVSLNGYCVMKEDLRALYSPSTGNLMTYTPMATVNTVSKMCYQYPSYQGGSVVYNWCAAVDTFYAAGGKPEIGTSDAYDSWPVTIPSGHRRGACPQGWHIPTQSEWAAIFSGYTNIQLSSGDAWTNFYGSANGAGNYENQERNSSGFSAVPNKNQSGYAYYSSTTTPSSSSTNTSAYYINYSADAPQVYPSWNRGNKVAVRCVRDY